MTTWLGNADRALVRAWHPVAISADVGTDPVAVRLLGQDWVLTRLGEGIAAFPDRCPHRLAPLSAGQVDVVAGRPVLRCGYHGWCFDAQGSCLEIPAARIADQYPPRSHVRRAHAVTERHGLVWLAPEAPLADLIDLGDDDEGFATSEVAVVRAKVGAGLIMDNFLDTAHFPFVHAATIGVEEDPDAHDPVIERMGLTMLVHDEHDFANHTDPGVAAGERPLRQRRRLEYRYAAPFSVALRIEELDALRTDLVTLFVQPIDRAECALYAFVRRSGEPSPEDMAAALKYELTILDEDLRIQERYVDLRLPLDLTVECHTRADRPTLELRRILADFVVEAERSARDISGEA